MFRNNITDAYLVKHQKFKPRPNSGKKFCQYILPLTKAEIYEDGDIAVLTFRAHSGDAVSLELAHHEAKMLLQGQKDEVTGVVHAVTGDKANILFDLTNTDGHSHQLNCPLTGVEAKKLRKFAKGQIINGVLFHHHYHGATWEVRKIKTAHSIKMIAQLRDKDTHQDLVLPSWIDRKIHEVERFTPSKLCQDARRTRTLQKRRNRQHRLTFN